MSPTIQNSCKTGSLRIPALTIALSLLAVACAGKEVLSSRAASPQSSRSDTQQNTQANSETLSALGDSQLTDRIFTYDFSSPATCLRGFVAYPAGAQWTCRDGFLIPMAPATTVGIRNSETALKNGNITFKIQGQLGGRGETVVWARNVQSAEFKQRIKLTIEAHPKGGATLRVQQELNGVITLLTVAPIRLRSYAGLYSLLVSGNNIRVKALNEGIVKWFNTTAVESGQVYFFSSAAEGGKSYYNKIIIHRFAEISAAAPQASVSLQAVDLQDGQLEILYAKNFDTCVHMLKDGRLTHAANYFCDNAPSGPLKLDAAAFAIRTGDRVKLCHGNDYSICSAEVTVQ